MSVLCYVDTQRYKSNVCKCVVNVRKMDAVPINIMVHYPVQRKLEQPTMCTQNHPMFDESPKIICRVCFDPFSDLYGKFVNNSRTALQLGDLCLVMPQATVYTSFDELPFMVL